MREKTYLTNQIEAADIKAKYNAQAIKHLRDKRILSWIMKYTVREMMELTVDEIMGCFDGEPQIQEVPVYPGKRQAVTALATVDAVPNEGEVTYDIRFNVVTPIGEHIKLIMDVEAQKEINPSYDPITRGVFYGARMLSAQLDDEFTGRDYDGLKKVYSIWIFMSTPTKYANTITEYHITQNDLYGKFARKARYDLLSVITVCLGSDDTEGGTKLHEVLRTLLSAKLAPAEKVQKLEDEYDIPSTREMKGDAEEMCNLADLIEERGIKIGEQKGIKIGEERGEKRGEKRGIKIGEKRGEERGKQHGEKRYAELTKRLAADGRMDDLLRAADNEQFRQSLYTEYGIS